MILDLLFEFYGVWMSLSSVRRWQPTMMRSSPLKAQV